MKRDCIEAGWITPAAGVAGQTGPNVAQFTVLDFLPLGVFVIDANWIVQFWNARLEAWTGLERSQMVGQSIMQQFPHLSQPTYLSRLEQIFTGGHPILLSSQLHPHLIPIHNPDGQLQIQQTTITALPIAQVSEQSTPQFYALWSIQDVTELTQQVNNYRVAQKRAWQEVQARRQMEAELHEMDAAMANALSGMSKINPEGRYVYVNHAYADTTGYTPEELLGCDWQQTVHPDELARMAAAYEQMQQDGRVEIETKGIRKDGSMFHKQVVMIASYDSQHRLLAHYCFMKDISDRKQAEATQQALIESIPDFLVRMHQNGTQLEVLNPGAIHLLAPRHGGITGSQITEVVPIHIGQERVALAAVALATRTVQTQEYQFELDGVTIYEEARIAPLTSDEVLVVVRDITDRKQAEQALRDSEAKFRQLAENIHQVFLLISPTGQVLYVSPAYEQIWQQSCASLYSDSQSWLTIIHPDDRPRMQAAMHHHLTHKTTMEETYRIIRPDGSVRWIAAHIVPLLDAAGQVIRFTGIAEDITREKAVETALRESEQTKQAIIQAIPDRLIRMRGDGTYVDFLSNNTVNGVQPSQSSDHATDHANIRDILPAELAQMRMRYTQRALVSGMTQVYEHAITVDDHLCYEEVRITPLLQDEVLVMVRDITSRKQAEKALLQQKEMFKAIVDRIPIMIVLFNKHGQIQFINPALESLLGWTITDWQHRDIFATCYPDPDYRQAMFNHMLRARGNWQDFTARTAMGEYLETTWASVRLSDGRFLGIGQDISDRKRQEQELRQAMQAAEAANLAKSAFLANMSHELRTPLNVILGFTQVMGHDSNLTPSQQDDLRTIRRSGDHLLSLINDVLDLSKIESGHSTIDSSGFNLISLLDTLHTMMAKRAMAKQVRMTLTIAPQVPVYVITDAPKLRQILLNLLSNAIKFTHHGEISLKVSVVDAETTTDTPPNPLFPSCPLSSTRRPTHSLTPAPSPTLLQFQVTDTGVGIPLADQEVIFEAFVQAEAGKQMTGGTGLGLTISRKLVELLHGTIQVQSQLQQGTTFTVQLPVLPTEVVPGTAMGGDRPIVGFVPGHPHYRILVVDDQLENRSVLVRWLNQFDLDVQAADSGQEALQVWQDWRPHLIWMDIRMADLDGYAVTQRIRELEQQEASECLAAIAHPTDSPPPSCPHAPTIIIALTAQAFQADVSLAYSVGCNDYILKPFHEETLFLKLKEHLGLDCVYADPNTPSIYPSYASVSLPESIKEQSTDALNLADLIQLANLPTNWLNQLETAAICGNDRAIAELTNELPPELVELGTQLTHLAEQFKFEQILELVQHS